MVYEPRNYRKLHSETDLQHFQVCCKETDLDIAIATGADRPDLTRLANELAAQYRRILEQYGQRKPVFLTTLEPYQPEEDAPSIVKEMCDATKLAGVGPMAAVAGLFAQRIGRELACHSPEVIVENGGDIWLKTCKTRRVAIFAGNSPFSYRIGVEIAPEQSPLGICTSSGTVGHSLSFGKADAAVILAPCAVLADAVATAVGNRVQDAGDLESAVDFALSIPGVSGAMVIIGDKMAVKGQVKLVPL